MILHHVAAREEVSRPIPVPRPRRGRRL